MERVAHTHTHTQVLERGGDEGIGGINVATLLQETNVASERWRISSSSVPRVLI
jgi:hypothetical protein